MVSDPNRAERMTKTRFDFHPGLAAMLPFHETKRPVHETTIKPYEQD
jgi:hypothetical protein